MLTGCIASHFSPSSQACTAGGILSTIGMSSTHETTQKASTVSTPYNLLELSSSIPDIPQFKPH